MLVSVLFFILRQPPSPTLFPYTTLFRSRGHHVVDGRVDHDHVRHLLLRPDARGARQDRGRGVEGMAGLAHQRAVLDRKSTRLNSSHGYISYAVFCLKKKTTSSSSCISSK